LENKDCKKCNEHKNLCEFEIRKDTKKHRNICKVCINKSKQNDIVRKQRMASYYRNKATYTSYREKNREVLKSKSQI
jgi:hypothetical protein